MYITVKLRKFVTFPKIPQTCGAPPPPPPPPNNHYSLIAHFINQEAKYFYTFIWQDVSHQTIDIHFQVFTILKVTAIRKQPS